MVIALAIEGDLLFGGRLQALAGVLQPAPLELGILGEVLRHAGQEAVLRLVAARAVRAGIEDVVAVDMSDTRLEIARKLGATHVVNPSKEDLWEGLGRVHGTETLYWMEMVGTNVFIEATGVGPLLADVVKRCAPQSRISVVALHRQEVPIAFMDVLTKEITIRGSIEYPADYGEMIRLIARRDLEPMITHRFGLDDEVMLKDNHADWGLAADQPPTERLAGLVAAARARHGRAIRVTAEARAASWRARSRWWDAWSSP